MIRLAIDTAAGVSEASMRPPLISGGNDARPASNAPLNWYCFNEAAADQRREINRAIPINAPDLSQASMRPRFDQQRGNTTCCRLPI